MQQFCQNISENLEDENIPYDVTWRVVSRVKPFNHVTGVRNLCTRENISIFVSLKLPALTLETKLHNSSNIRLKEYKSK